MALTQKHQRQGEGSFQPGLLTYLTIFVAKARSSRSEVVTVSNRLTFFSIAKQRMARSATSLLFVLFARRTSSGKAGSDCSPSVWNPLTARLSQSGLSGEIHFFMKPG